MLEPVCLSAGAGTDGLQGLYAAIEKVAINPLLAVSSNNRRKGWKTTVCGIVGMTIIGLLSLTYYRNFSRKGV